MKKKIFVIEDDAGIRNNLRAFLESEGFDVETAGDGREALYRIKAAEELPSLIILDLMLPVMDGFQFRKGQENDPRISNIPVVIVTAGGNIESKSMLIGAKGHLKKPFNLDEVLATVQRFAR